VGSGVFLLRIYTTHGATKTWTGTVSSSWNNASNWSGGIPGAGDVATFDNTCTNCNVTIDAAVNVAGFNMTGTYTGTITQSGSNTITVGASGWTHAGGTFTANGSAITINGPYAQTGGTFNAGSSTISVTGNWTETSGTWNAATSTLQLLNNGYGGSHTITPGSVSYYNASFDTWNNIFTLAADMTVSHNLTISGSAYECILLGSTIFVGGNLDVSTGSGIRNDSTTAIVINGTGAQTLSSTGGGAWKNITVNKSSGTLEVSTSIDTQATTFTLTSGVVSLQSGTTLSIGALSVASLGTLIGNNASLTLAGNVTNAGSITFKKSAICGSTDTIAIHSSSNGVQRTWSGAGTFSFADAEVKDQGGSAAITAYSSTNTSGNGGNWTFNATCPGAPTTVRIESGMVNTSGMISIQ
jgi:hypothetical protein